MIDHFVVKKKCLKTCCAHRSLSAG